MKRFELEALPHQRSAGRAVVVPTSKVSATVVPGSQLDDRLTRADALKLMSARDRRPMDDQRTCMARCWRLVDDARKNGDLTFRGDDTIALGDFIAWIWTKPWLRKKFADLPASLKPSATLQAALTCGTTMTAELSPMTLQECRTELGEAKVLIREQKVRLAAMQLELDEVRPLVLKRQEIRAVRRISGAKKKPRR